MRFLIDAQLPRRMTVWLHRAGADAIHTLELPEQNRTSDSRIVEVCNARQRVLVTKDADFVDSHSLHGLPAKLLLISTGNISNGELEILMLSAIPISRKRVPSERVP